VQKTQKGCPDRGTLRCASAEAGRRSIDTLRRRRIRRAIARTREACERRAGEIRSKTFASCPRGTKPKGGASGCRLKPPHGHKALSRGTNPGIAALRAGPPLWRWNNHGAKRYVGSPQPKRLRVPPERGNLRRVNPRSAAGAKQHRHGIRGSKPPRG